MQYVGIPFVDGGRSASGVDCWGLAKVFLETEFGIAVPAYGETPAADLAGSEAAVSTAMTDGTWRRVERSDLRRGDIVVMYGVERVKGRLRKTRRHVGVMVDSRRMLHVEEGVDSVIVGLSHESVRGRLESFWRHRDLV